MTPSRLPCHTTLAANRKAGVVALAPSRRAIHQLKHADMVTADAAASSAVLTKKSPVDYPKLFFQSCMQNQITTSAIAPFVAIAETIHLLFHWYGVGEAERFDAHIRMKRWLNRIDELAEGKRKIEKAFSFSKKKWQTMGLAKWLAWAQKEGRIRGAATKLKLKRAFIHKWRVEFMGLVAEIKVIKDRIREVVDPVMAAKMRGVEAFEEQIRIKKMFIRARQHHVRSYLIRKWAGAIARKKALQAKIDGMQQRSEEYKAKVRFWKAMERVMEEARTKKRAASAFTMRAPRLAWNQWELMLDLRREARRMAVWACATEGKHVDFVKRSACLPAARRLTMRQCRDHSRLDALNEHRRAHEPATIQST